MLLKLHHWIGNPSLIQTDLAKGKINKARVDRMNVRWGIQGSRRSFLHESFRRPDGHYDFRDAKESGNDFGPLGNGCSGRRWTGGVPRVRSLRLLLHRQGGSMAGEGDGARAKYGAHCGRSAEIEYFRGGGDARTRG